MESMHHGVELISPFKSEHLTKAQLITWMNDSNPNILVDLNIKHEEYTKNFIDAMNYRIHNLCLYSSFIENILFIGVYYSHEHVPKLAVNPNGDAIDLYTAFNEKIPPHKAKLIDLGVSITMPKGMTAYLISRSSTFSKHGLIMANSVGVIDNSYCGVNDNYLYNAYNPGETEVKVPAGTRLAQVVFYPSMMCEYRDYLAKKTKICFVEFDINDFTLTANRGGFGTSGN